MAGIDDTLAERGKRYGDFADHSALSQKLKTAMTTNSGYTQLSSIHREALDMIQHKIARIINGDADYDDSWVDISGYATLVVKDIQKRTKK